METQKNENIRGARFAWVPKKLEKLFFFKKSFPDSSLEFEFTVIGLLCFIMYPKDAEHRSMPKWS